MYKPKTGIKAQLLSTTVLSLSAIPAMAQDTPTTQESILALEEIVVTAQRREQSLQDTALALEVFNGDTMENLGITGANEFQKLVPGLQIGLSGSAPQVFLRGVGDFATTSANSPAVPFYVDGVYVPRSYTIGADLYDMERVEVLKGPQGTLYGRNASGGAINVISKRPVIGESGGNASFEIGGYDDRDFGDNVVFNGALNIPLGENTAVRVAANYVDKGGFVGDEDIGSQERTAARIRLLHESNDQLSILLNASYADIGGGATPNVLQDPELRGDFTAYASPEGEAAVRANLPPVLQDIYTHPTTDGAFVDIESINLSAEINYDFGPATLTVIPAYRSAEQSYFDNQSFQFRNGVAFNSTAPFPFSLPVQEALAANPESSDAISLEVRLSGETDRMNWVIGGYYFDEEQDQQFSVDQGVAQNIIFDFDLATESFALFGQADYAIQDNLRLIFGARYTEDTRDIIDGRSFAINTSGGCNFNLGGPFAGPVIPGTPGFISDPLCQIDAYDDSATYDDVSWKYGIEADVFEDSLFYATVSRGFKAGGFNTNSAFGGTGTEADEYDPETLTSYDIGLKNNLMDGQLQLNIEAFFWDYKDHQEPIILQTQSGGLNRAFVNAGGAEIYGINVSTVAQPWQGGKISAGLEWIQSEYTDFVYQVPQARFGTEACINTPADNFTVSPAGPGFSGPFNVDCSGFDVARAPEISINMNFNQEFNVGNALIVANANVTYADERFAGVAFNDNQLADSYTLVDLTGTYYHPGNVWSLGLFVRNALNEEVIANTDNHNFSGVGVAAAQPSRSYGMRINFDF